MNVKLLFVPLLLMGCWATTEVVEVVRPVKLAKVEPLVGYSKEFIGEFSPVEVTTIAFSLGGTLLEVAVSDGQRVKKGDVIARLDPADYLLQERAQRATYLADSAAMVRSDRLLKRGAVSTQENEMTRARFEASRARYIYALDELSSTTLRAPLSGSVEKCYVDNFQRVAAGEAICKIIEPNSLEVDFILPQNDIALTSSASYSIIIDSTKEYSAIVKEVVDASVDGAGIPVTLTISDNNFSAQGLSVRAGFACKVRARIDSTLTSDSYATVPLTALDNNHVWIYNPSKGRVELRAITLAGLTDTNLAIISHGLRPKEQVVTAGIHLLTNNERVKPLQR